MTNPQCHDIRHLRDGDWYWIHKAVIRQYAPKVGTVAIVVYNLLASMANAAQACFPSQKYLAQCLGYSRATVNRAIQVLQGHGLIRVEKRSRYHCVYRLLKVRCLRDQTQMSRYGASDVRQEDTNDNKININNNDIDDKSIFSKTNTFQGFKPRTREEELACDLAQSLNDREGLALYLAYARRYPESLLRRIAAEVREISPERIKKGRGALFNYLITKHAQETTHHSGDQPGNAIPGDRRP